MFGLKIWLVEVDDGDGDVISVPSGQLCWQTQHLGESLRRHGSVAVVPKGVAEQVSGGVLVLEL